MTRGTDMSYLMRSLTTEIKDQRPRSKMLSPQHEMATRSGGRRRRVGKLFYSERTGYQPGFI